MSSTNLEAATQVGPHTSTAVVPVEPHQLEQILVPIDFSAPSEAALCHAILLAERFGAKINLIHVIDPKRCEEELVEWHGDLKRLTKAARGRLSGIAERLIKPSSTGAVQVRIGHAVEQISAAAKETGCDLIVIASHGYTGLKYVLIGSVAEQIARDAPFPVLVVRRSVEGVLGPFALAHVEKILVPVDFSPASLHAVAYALWFAQGLGAKVTVLHVVEPPGLSTWLGAEMPTLYEKLREAAEAKLKALGAERAERQIKTGVPLNEILNAAADGGFDLMVVSTHGRAGIRGHLLGSTAERLLRHAPCPVLIARERKDTPTSDAFTRD